jgi:hypothetical protein
MPVGMLYGHGNEAHNLILQPMLDFLAYAPLPPDVLLKNLVFVGIQLHARNSFAQYLPLIVQE